MTNNNETTTIRLAWEHHSTQDATRIDTADWAGCTIFRLRSVGADDVHNDSFLVTQDGAKVGTAASVGQARKLAERA